MQVLARAVLISPKKYLSASAVKSAKIHFKLNINLKLYTYYQTAEVKFNYA